MAIQVYQIAAPAGEESMKKFSVGGGWFVGGWWVDGGWFVGWQDAADGEAVARRVLGSRHGRRSEFRLRALSSVGN